VITFTFNTKTAVLFLVLSLPLLILKFGLCSQQANPDAY